MGYRDSSYQDAERARAERIQARLQDPHDGSASSSSPITSNSSVPVFSRGQRRYYWDKDARSNLSREIGHRRHHPSPNRRDPYDDRYRYEDRRPGWEEERMRFRERRRTPPPARRADIDGDLGRRDPYSYSSLDPGVGCGSTRGKHTPLLDEKAKPVLAEPNAKALNESLEPLLSESRSRASNKTIPEKSVLMPEETKLDGVEPNAMRMLDALAPVISDPPSFQEYGTRKSYPQPKGPIATIRFGKPLHVEKKKRIIPEAATADYVVEMVHEWANICDELHPICFNSPSSPLQNSSRLPTRILDLGEADAEAKIISGNAIKAKYVALSYCWGTEVDSHPKITKATLPIWSINLPSDILPVLFGDAISLTRALGVRYLWIDSLCILQDDIHDWEMESENMAAVYEGSWLTIAATLAPSPGISLLGPRWSRKTHSQAQTNSPVTKTERAELHCPPELFSMEKVMSWINPKYCEEEYQIISQWAEAPDFSEGFHQQHRHKHSLYEPERNHPDALPSFGLCHDRFRNTDNAEAHITDAPLMTRAWAFQERLLAPRTLHFHAEELAWECRAGVTCECGELEVETQSNISEDWRPTGWLKKSLTVVKNPKATTDQIGYVWLDIVSEFSKLHLTKESDRMPALSGIASTMCDGIMGEYIAGIWRNDLPCGLLFERARKAQHTSNDHRDLLETSDPSKPSWSWSSFPLNEFPISYDSVLRRKFVQDPEFSVLDARVNTGESAKNRFSWPANTTLSVRGRVWKVRFRLFEEDSFISHDSKNSSVSLAFLNDGTVELKEGELLHCLFVGKTLAGSDSQYALVLRRCTRYYRTFQRVGLAYIDKVFGLPTTNTLSDCVLI